MSIDLVCFAMGLCCRFIGLFCRYTGLFCGDVRLLLSKASAVSLPQLAENRSHEHEHTHELHLLLQCRGVA